MIQRLVITSVEHGLGTGPGLQPVLRTKGMRPAVAERLRLRGSYAHPYPFGDARNPVIHFHRIEQVGGQRLHVLGRVGDAGSDYSGRSNRISDLLVLDEPECRTRPCGPVAIAESFSWYRSWSEPPREVEGMVNLGSCRAEAPMPRGCVAWSAAVGDAGWGGELSKAFLDGRGVLIVARPEDDIFRLFWEAMRTVPPEKRWNVTFTTCELEPFPASWRAVRSDITRLPRSGGGQSQILDLDAIARSKAPSPDHAYARFARGEGPPPWAPDRGGFAPPRIQASSSGPLTFPFPANRGVRASSRQTVDVGAAIRRRREAARDRRMPEGDKAADGLWARNRLATMATLAVPLLLIALGVTYVAWVQLDPQAAAGLRRVFTRAPVLTPLGQPEDAIDLEGAEQRRVREIIAARQRKQRSDDDEAERREVEKRIAEDRRRTEEANDQQKKLADTELAGRRREEQVALERKASLREEAFSSFEKLCAPGLLMSKTSTLDPLSRLSNIDFGTYQFEHLEEPSFALATPPFLINGAKAALLMESGSNTPAMRTWKIRARIPQRNDVSSNAPEMQDLPVCTIVAKNDRVFLEWDPDVKPQHQGVRMLRNGVVVASCREPEMEARKSVPLVLEKPTHCSAIHFDLLDDSKKTTSFGIKDRLECIDPAAIRWRVTFRHASHRSSLDNHMAAPVRQVISLPPLAELNIPYETVGDDGKVLPRNASLTLTGTLAVNISGDEIVWTPMIQLTAGSPEWVKREFTFERLRDCRDGKGADDLRKAFLPCFTQEDLKEALYSRFRQGKKVNVPETLKELDRVKNDDVDKKKVWQDWQEWFNKHQRERVEAFVSELQKQLKAAFSERIVVRCDKITVDAVLPETHEKHEITVAQSKTSDDDSPSE